MDIPIAITGLGMITAQGIGVESSWKGALEARAALHPWTNAPSFLAHLHVAQCPDPPRPSDLPPRFWKKLSRIQQFTAVAVDEALAFARLPHHFFKDAKSAEKSQKSRTGLFLATTVCGMDLNERYYAQYRENRETADSDLMRRLLPWEVSEFISRRHGVGLDPSLRQVCLTTCVGSAMAIGNAADAVALGECDIAIAGGAEALCQVVLAGFNALKVVAPQGCRPFDLNRPGITVGEGAGILILESIEHARARDIQPIAYLRGFGVTCDAHHLTAPDPAATQAIRAVREALARAGLIPGDIGYINAHGTGTRDNDSMESRVIDAVFGPDSPPISSTKRSTGHTFGAAAAIESIFCLQALREKLLPPNAGTQIPDPSLNVSVIRNSPLWVPEFHNALCTNFAFGGNNSALIFSISDIRRYSRQSSVNASEGLSLQGLGLVTDQYASLSAFVQSRPNSTFQHFPPAQLLDAASVAQHDALVQLTLRATHEAWTMASLQEIPGERIGLIFVSAWGTIDSTVAYLDSMLDAEGRYASPRHFSRSVYSAVASLNAIHFNIQGPCETLTFGKNPVKAALHQARRILAMGRADRIIVVWAEQSAEIAHDLTHRAVNKLRRKEYARYAKSLGQGAIALVLSHSNVTGICTLKTEDFSPPEPHMTGINPFASDAALAWVAHFLTGQFSRTPM